MQVPNTAMKGLLKGLRYISQVFEGEKEEEMQIGNPTDVKHVAHIGWDGPSASTNSTPSWMNDFKNSNSEPAEDNSSAKCQSECGVTSKDLPKLPKSTRKSVSEQGSPIKEKSDKSKRKTSRRSKETSKDSSSSSQRSVGIPGLPKKSKKKKSKETRNDDSLRSSRASEVDKMSDYTSDTGSVRSMPQLDQDKDGF